MNGEVAAQFREAVARYNRGDYFGAQELLEQVYRASDAGEQPMVRAMAMLSTAMHLHFRRGGGRGVLNLLRQCLLLLDDRRPESLGVNVEELYEGLEAYLQDLSERRKAGAGFFDRWLAPRVRFVGKPEEGPQAS